jgi:hypothetical protein
MNASGVLGYNSCNASRQRDFCAMFIIFKQRGSQYQWKIRKNKKQHSPPPIRRIRKTGSRESQHKTSLCRSLPKEKHTSFKAG